MAKDRIEIGTEPGHPGAFAGEEVLAPLGPGISKAARVLGARRATPSDLADEKAALSPETALRIEKAFGLDMD